MEGTPLPVQESPDLPPPMQQPKKSNKTLIIILIVVLALCCICLCISGVFAYNNGDALIEQMEEFGYLLNMV